MRAFHRVTDRSTVKRCGEFSDIDVVVLRPSGSALLWVRFTRSAVALLIQPTSTAIRPGLPRT